MGSGYQVYLDQHRLAVSGDRCRSVFSPVCRLGSTRSDKESTWHLCLAQDPETRPGMIQRTDRASQYASEAYRKILKAHHSITSMSGKGNCYDNAMVETVCTTIKVKLLWCTAFQSRDAAINTIGASIADVYAPVLRHSSLG